MSLLPRKSLPVATPAMTSNPYLSELYTHATVGLGAVTTLLAWALTPVKFPQYDQTTGDAIADPPAIAPIDVLRRIAKAGG